MPGTVLNTYCVNSFKPPNYPRTYCYYPPDFILYRRIMCCLPGVWWTYRILHFNKYSWPLNNTGLNGAGPHTHIFYLIINTAVLHSLGLANSEDVESYTVRADSLSYTWIFHHWKVSTPKPHVLRVRCSYSLLSDRLKMRFLTSLLYLKSTAI